MGFVGNVIARVGADISGFQSNLATASASLTAFANKNGAALTAFNKNLSKEMKMLNVEMMKAQQSTQLAIAQMGNNAKASDINKARMAGLTQQLNIQRQAVASLQKEYERSLEKYGANALATKKLEVSLLGARTSEINMQNTLKDGTSFFTRHAAAIESVGLATAAAIGYAATKVTQIAIDAKESENLFNVSMGSMRDKAVEFAKGLHESLGINEVELHRNIGMFYMMSRSLGTTTEQSYKMSTSLTQLAYDMSSLYNLPFQDAIIKLQAGLSGESEPLKRLGIVVNESTTKQYAYAKGIAKVGSELTEQQKVLGRYEAIMANTVGAQGDLKATIDSTANQLKVLGSNWTTTMGILGSGTEPFVNSLVHTMNALFPLIDSFATKIANALKGAYVGFQGFTAYLGSIFAGDFSLAWQRAQIAAENAQKYFDDYDENVRARARLIEQNQDANNALLKSQEALNKAQNEGIQSFDEVHQLQQKTADATNAAADANNKLAESVNGGKDDKDKPIMPPIIGWNKGDGAPVTPPQPSPINITAVDNATPVINAVKSGLDSIPKQISIPVNIQDNTIFTAPAIQANLAAFQPKQINVPVNIIDLSAAARESFRLDVDKMYDRIFARQSRFESASEGLSKVHNEQLAADVQNANKQITEETINWQNSMNNIYLAHNLNVNTILDDAHTKMVNSSSKSFETISTNAANMANSMQNNIVGAVNKSLEALAKLPAGMGIKTAAPDKVTTSTILSDYKPVNLNVPMPYKSDDAAINFGTGKGHPEVTFKESLINMATSLGLIGAEVAAGLGITLGAGALGGVGASAAATGVAQTTIVDTTMLQAALKALQQSVPKFATGGIVSSPTLAVVGEAGPEVIVPLSGGNNIFADLKNEIKNDVISAISNTLNSSQREIIINMDTTQVARVMVPALTKENSRIGTTAIIQGR